MRHYFYTWIEQGIWFGGTKVVAFYGEFDIGEAHEVLKREEGAKSPIILSWQEISHSQFESYGRYSQKVQDAKKPRLSLVNPEEGHE